MKDITLHNLFYGFSDKTNEVLGLEDLLIETQKKVQSFKEQILNEGKLHVILTTVGIVHEKKIYKKLIKIENKGRYDSTVKDSDQYYLDVQDYIKPFASYSLDSELGESNE